jgi:hypothetical protein
MKKLLLGLIFLASACAPQTAAPTPETFPSPTATLPTSPTLVPATNTPEPTPTLEPTPTPLPRFYTHEFDSSLAGWSILQAGNETIPNATIENSTLRLQMDTPYTWLYALYGAQEYENVHVETQFTNSALSPASMGLVCQYNEADGWLEYNIYTDGTYNVLYGKWLATEVADYQPVVDGSSKEIGQSGITQHIGMTCSGTTLQLYINETIIRNVDVSRFELAGGKVGITASSFDSVPVVAVFDWVKINEP